jgi:hypothetical protein
VTSPADGGIISGAPLAGSPPATGSDGLSGTKEFPWMIDVIKREKAIKSWPRKWKIDLIEKTNPDGGTCLHIS